MKVSSESSWSWLDMVPARTSLLGCCHPLPLDSLQELPGEVSGGEQYLPHLQDRDPSEPPITVYRVSKNMGWCSLTMVHTSAW